MFDIDITLLPVHICTEQHYVTVLHYMSVPTFRRQKYNQTLLLVNNWMIRGIQAHGGIATLVTQHIHAITFLFMHYTV